MIGFVIWPPLLIMDAWYKKGGQVTKPIIVVKISCIIYHSLTQMKRYLINTFLALLNQCFWSLITSYDGVSDWPQIS